MFDTRRTLRPRSPSWGSINIMIWFARALFAISLSLSLSLSLSVSRGCMCSSFYFLLNVGRTQPPPGISFCSLLRIGVVGAGRVVWKCRAIRRESPLVSLPRLVLGTWLLVEEQAQKEQQKGDDSRASAKGTRPGPDWCWQLGHAETKGYFFFSISRISLLVPWMDAPECLCPSCQTKV